MLNSYVATVTDIQPVLLILVSNIMFYHYLVITYNTHTVGNYCGIVLLNINFTDDIYSCQKILNINNKKKTF